MHTPLPVPGDIVWIRQRRWRVERTSRDRTVVRLDVARRDRRLTFLTPFDHAVAAGRRERPRRANPQRASARLAHLLGRSHDGRLPMSAVDATVDLLPHQLEPVLATMAGRRRVLIADDVGLGKTIQAALVIAEVCRLEPAPRILIIVPASLRDQWTDELRRRFRLDCRLVDRRALDEMSRAESFGGNPWRRPGVWITSADFLKQPHVASALPLDPWHLVVIDEAHTVCGDSDRYAVCDEVSRRSVATVSLTATPHSGDDSRFQRLLALGRLSPDDRVTIFRRGRADIGLRVARNVRWLGVPLSDAESRVFEALRSFERGVLAASRRETRDNALLLLSVFRKRALSTMRALSRSLGRRLAWLGDAATDEDLAWTQPHLGFDAESDATEDDERQGLTTHIGLDPRRERAWLRRIRLLADRAGRIESKACRAAAIVRRAREPVVIFTEFRDSQAVLIDRLRSLPVSVLHGEMAPAERRQSLDRFLSGAAAVLVATDVAGQGLNLQTRARWVISLELPWNPARLEQRIGRVDRIGQARPTHFTLLVANDEAESGLLSHLARRVLQARRSIGPDALRQIVPEERIVRAALLDGQAPVPSQREEPATAACRRYTRAAVVAARALERRRLAVRRWRAPDGSAGGPVSTSMRRLPALARLSPAGLLVFSVPLLDAGLALMARCVVAVGCAVTPATLRDQTTMDGIRARVAQAAVRYLRRARHRAAARGAVARSRDEALARLIREDRLGDLQPGLFDRRDIRERTREVRRRSALAVWVEAETGGEPHAGGLRLGQPVLEVALVGT